MVKVSAWTKIIKSLMENIVVELLKALKEESIICFPCLTGMDAQKLRETHGAFVKEAWRYPFVILGKNNVHMKKVYVNPS